MSARVCISYRRDDAAGHVGRLYDALAARLGPDAVFMDIDRIEPGQHFANVLASRDLHLPGRARRDRSAMAQRRGP